MPEQDARHPRHGHPRDLVPGRGQGHLVPDGRQRLRQVRVPAEQGSLLAPAGPATAGPFAAHALESGK